MKKTWPKRGKSDAEEQPAKDRPAPRVHAPNPPIRFDPRWAPCNSCKACTPEQPCTCMCHGGWKLAQAVRHMPTEAWSDALRTAVCFLCQCATGAHCERDCECHVPQESVAVAAPAP